MDRPMENSHIYQDWQLEKRQNNVWYLTFDKKDRSSNVLDVSALEQLEKICDDLMKVIRPTALVMQSGKINGFILGADIQTFKTFEKKEDAANFIALGHRVFSKIESFPFITIALIEGLCLGGGMELALSCRYRIALDESSVCLGLPEVLLGIHPGWGGTVRLPRLIGVLKAMPLILSGKIISAEQAKKMHIVDECLPKRHIQMAINTLIATEPEPWQPSFFYRCLEYNFLRPLIQKMMMGQLKKKINAKQYPAPFIVLENWLAYGSQSNDALENEAKTIVELFHSNQTKHLLALYLLREQLKSRTKTQPFNIQHIHVIGAGVMGGDIAAVCAEAGFKVTLQDTHLQTIGHASKRAKLLFEKKYKKNYQVNAILDKFMPDPTGFGIAKADVIIEAIIENKAIKQALFKEIALKAKPGALLATNTSTIPLKEIRGENKALNLVGLHFFNPVPQMPLVEIVKDSFSSEESIQKALYLIGKLKKLPILVESKPGFLVNRVLLPYLMESVLLLEEGYAPSAIDEVCKDFGMPMGPIELADTVGLDVCLFAAKELREAYGFSIPNALVAHVEKGQLGKKTGHGFYQYNKKGQPRKHTKETQALPQDSQDRMILRLINESLACLREGIVQNANDLNAGMIFGTGFAPFRGGPMGYLQSEGAETIASKLSLLAEAFGPRFKPDPYFKEIEQINTCK